MTPIEQAREALEKYYNSPEAVRIIDAGYKALDYDRAMAISKHDVWTILKGALASLSPTTPVDGVEAEPRVKPLEWKPGGGDGIMSIRADAIGLRYYIFKCTDDGLWHAYTEGYQQERFGEHETVEAAKAAVRIGHERRILSALASPEAEARLRERVADKMRETLLDYRQTEVDHEDGGGYPLIDALTLKGYGVDMGEREVDNIVSELMYAILPLLPAEARLRERVHYAEGTAQANIDRANEAERRAEAAEARLAKAERAQCERCQGNGEIVTDWDRYMKAHPGDIGDEAVAECTDCDGTGITYQTERRCACQTDAHEEAEHFLRVAIDRSPEPLRRLGEYLAEVLDEDQFPKAERLLLGIAEARLAQAGRVEEQGGPAVTEAYAFEYNGEGYSATGERAPQTDAEQVTETMVERAAKAIVETDHTSEGLTFTELSRAMARAALEAALHPQSAAGEEGKP